ncbi:FAD-binding oxidoreductase [Longivirga aurantiaca]|uniref:Delta(24)-sterol reductase n=1 Tax=Longivirga aurantiaca TaxID=1837743 RepID=A0ABW1SXR9_9ACTN
MALTVTPTVTRSAYDRAVDALVGQYRALPAGAPVRLAKTTSNLFRARSATGTPGLDVAAFRGVLEVDVEARTADVLGMTTYEELVAATLPHGLVPLCVPQLRTITLGGAVTGLGIESASWRNGCPHESVLDLDVLTGDGRVVTATLDNEHSALFHGFPNSYGSLGYALRLRIELEPVTPFMALRHVPCGDAASLATAISDITASGSYDGTRVDYVDGTVFSATESYLTLATYAETASRAPSDYTGEHIYYRSIQQRRTDLLTTHDYLWRWDTDWFWCSRAFGVQKPLVRRLWPTSKLRSDVYWKLVALDRRTSFSARLDSARRRPAREQVVQDVEVPVGALSEFLDFFHREVGIEPVWVCPLRQRDPGATWSLYELDPSVTYVNVGFWSTVPLPEGVTPAEGRVNRRIERVVTELGGKKSLYSTAFYPPEEFARIYGGDAYSGLRATYDPGGRLPDMWTKTVGRG